MRVLAFCVGGAALALAGCAQLTTNKTERAGLEAAATKAGDAYVQCVVDASQRYQGTDESSGVIAEVSKKGCGQARDAFVKADTAYLQSKYMLTEALLGEQLAALDERATQEVAKGVLDRKAAAPVAAAAATDGKGYLDCMRTQGERYAAVNEPAEVVAEVAHGRCAGQITDPASAAQLERQGRALVMGIVLDRKAGG